MRSARIADEKFLCLKDHICLGGVAMYCPNCGKEIDDGDNHCTYCGGQIGKESGPARPNYPIVYREKELGIGLIFALILTGGGQLYAGKVVRGIVILLVCMFVLVPMLIAAISIGFISAVDFDSSFSAVGAVISGVGGLVYFVFWIWTLYDTKVQIDKYNDHLRRNGRPPW